MAGEKKSEELEPILAAIVRRNVNLSLNGATQEAVSSALNRLQIVRLDREGITTLSNLEAISKAHSLYLQENQIKKIENLEVLKNLQFLSLSGNRIEKIQNLHCLRILQFLDLSNNLIQKLNPGELPQNLLVLDMSGNLCTKTNGYRQQVLQVLPHLQELDGVTVRVSCDQRKSDTEYEKEDSDSDDTSLLSEESDSLSSVAQDMLQRSLQRRKRALQEHEDRLAELNESRDGQSLLSSRDEVCRAEMPGISYQNIDSQDKASSQTKKHNTIKSNKEHQPASLLEKNTRDLYKAGKAVFKNQTAVSPTQSSAGVLTEKKSHSRSITMPSRTPSLSNTQTKVPQTSKHSAEIKGSTTSCTLKERQTAKSTRHIPGKATAPSRSAMSAPNPRQAVSSKKL